VKVILAIDDTPVRYVRVAKELASAEIALLVTWEPEVVRFYLRTYKPMGILLDHDMPIQNGNWFAENLLKEYSHPVLVVSHNPTGAQRIKATLDDWFVSVKIDPIPVETDKILDWLDRAKNFFNTHSQESSGFTKILEQYVCSVCGVGGVKLWREAHFDAAELWCAECGCKHVGIPNSVDDKGKIISVLTRTPTDQLYGKATQRTLLPAVPTLEPGIYWAYTSVPYNDMVWWTNLPLTPNQE
jgi:hypothetical protein